MFWFHNNGIESSAIEELSTMSDRAAAIVAAVLLENRIEEALKYFLLNHQKNASFSIHDEMFRNSGPLGSFSAKINLGYMLGLYTSGAWRDIDCIRDIRNDFAHDLKIQDFNSDSIRSRCNNIKWFEQFIHEHGTTPEKQLEKLNSAMAEQNLVETFANPRRRYLLAVRFYYASLSFLPESLGVSPGDLWQAVPPLCKPRV